VRRREKTAETATAARDAALDAAGEPAAPLTTEEKLADRYGRRH
jgi:hypothetical protein